MKTENLKNWGGIHCLLNLGSYQLLGNRAFISLAD